MAKLLYILAVTLVGLAFTLRRAIPDNFRCPLPLGKYDYYRSNIVAFWLFVIVAGVVALIPVLNAVQGGSRHGRYTSTARAVGIPLIICGGLLLIVCISCGLTTRLGGSSRAGDVGRDASVGGVASDRCFDRGDRLVVVREGGSPARGNFPGFRAAPLIPIPARRGPLGSWARPPSSLA